MNLAESVGYVFGLLTMAAVLTAIPLVVSSVRGKPMNRAQTWSVFAVACVVIIVVHLVARGR